MSVRVQGATLVLGGLGLSWLIIRLRGKDKYRTEYVQQRKSKEVIKNFYCCHIFIPCYRKYSQSEYRKVIVY